MNLVDLNTAHLLPHNSGGQKSEMGFPGLKSKCWQGSVPFEGSTGESFPCLFQPLEAALIPWLMAP